MKNYFHAMVFDGIMMVMLAFVFSSDGFIQWNQWTSLLGRLSILLFVIFFFFDAWRLGIFRARK